MQQELPHHHMIWEGSSNINPSIECCGVYGSLEYDTYVAIQ